MSHLAAGTLPLSQSPVRHPCCRWTGGTLERSRFHQLWQLVPDRGRRRGEEKRGGGRVKERNLLSRARRRRAGLTAQIIPKRSVTNRVVGQKSSKAPTYYLDICFAEMGGGGQNHHKQIINEWNSQTLAPWFRYTSDSEYGATACVGDQATAASPAYAGRFGTRSDSNSLVGKML